jgi:hypothetical protein
MRGGRRSHDRSGRVDEASRRQSIRQVKSRHADRRIGHPVVGVKTVRDPSQTAETTRTISSVGEQ